MPTVDFAMNWERNHDKYDYSVHITPPADNDTWKYHSKSVSKNGEIVFGRSNRTSMQLNNKVGYYALSEKLTGEEYTDMGTYISGYGINLEDERIRLFAINKNKYGYAELNRIQISPELLKIGQSLSRL